jgi:hypothetical protein
MVVPELNCCALDSFRLFTVSSPQIKEDPVKCSPTGWKRESPAHLSLSAGHVLSWI